MTYISTRQKKKPKGFDLQCPLLVIEQEPGKRFAKLCLTNHDQ